ncbi:hypothetical protein Tco_1068058 [Tanacetum coccineum]|uniref:Uncharacterized protein n=1 Tax=Tanacetum coccineum TaxID=301880 RepID=A0ABQ5HEQ6_9ASTR
MGNIEAKIEADSEIGTKKKTLCSQKSRSKEEQTTNKSSTEKDNEYLSEEHGRIYTSTTERFQVRRYSEDGSSKRARAELEQESSKKQKMDDDDDMDTAELQSLIEINSEEEDVAINVIPLATNPLAIVDCKIHKEGKNSYYQIIRADKSSKLYLIFSTMLKDFDREDLVELYKLVMNKYGSTRPEKGMDLILWGDLKTMFEPHVEDDVWKLQHRLLKVTAASGEVSAAQSRLMLLKNLKEKRLSG